MFLHRIPDIETQSSQSGCNRIEGIDYFCDGGDDELYLGRKKGKDSTQASHIMARV